MAKQGQLDSTFTVVCGKQPGDEGVSGEVGGEPLVDHEKDVSSGGSTEIVGPFKVVFQKKG